MNSRERVLAALHREPTDRIPIFMWFHPETTARLAEMLELTPAEVPFALGNDVCQRWIGNNYAMEGIVHECDGEGHTDDWGISWARYDGFNQVVASPLADLDPARIEAYRFPYHRLESLLQPLAGLEPYRGTYFLGADVSPCLFELLCRLFGMTGAMLALAEETTGLDALIERAADFNCALAEAACTRFRPDWLWTGDDIGGQGGMMISPEMWRRRFKPRLRRIFQVVQAHGLPIAYHSCGAIRPVIGDLLELGLNVLNPLQCNCPGMDPAELKREFGAELTFMGGVDTQELLPRGSADQVRAATARLIEVMTADGGGYILAASHTIPPETPLANIFALYQEAGLSREQILDAASDLRRKRDGKTS